MKRRASKKYRFTVLNLSQSKFDKPTINFIEGRINFGERNKSVDCDYEDLNSLADGWFIERRQPSAGRHYYYVEAARGSMRFAVFIRLKEKRIEWLPLRWLDRPMKGWDDVSEKAMTDKYNKISNFVKQHVKPQKP